MLISLNGQTVEDSLDTVSLFVCLNLILSKHMWLSETGVLSCLNFLDPCWFLGSRCFSNSPLFQYFCQNLDCVPTITPLTVSPNVTLDVDIEHDTETDDHADELLDELHDFKQACLLFSWGKHNK